MKPAPSVHAVGLGRVSAAARRRHVTLRRILSSSVVLTTGILLQSGLVPAHAADLKGIVDIPEIRISKAASTPAQSAGAPAEIEEVIVTGSRIVRDGYEAPTPTTVVGVDDIQARSPANVADYINQMPQLGNATSPLTTRGSSNTIGGNSNLLNMRGLGTARTLVLLDGRRQVSAGLNSAVDLNLLPTNLTSRVDIVTGGASAAYGSDAVAGVTNIILDSNFTGVKGNTSYYITRYGDGETFNADAAGGFGFAGDKGHAIFSAMFVRANGIDTATQRDWYNPGFKLIANPAYVAGGTIPAMITRNDVDYGKLTDGGLIVSGPLKGVAFGPGGVPYTFTFGPIQSGNLQAGGTFEDPATESELTSDNQYWTLFGRAHYDVTDKIRAEAEVGFGKSDSHNWSATPSRFGDLVISNQNPYIPASVLAQMAANKVTTFTMGRTNDDLHQPDGHVTTIGYHRQQERWLVSLNGDLSDYLDKANWNVYYQRGTSQVRYNYYDMTIPSYFSLAADAVPNPAVGGVAGVAVGAPVCRSTLTNPTNGCVPANVFGRGSISAAAINYITGVAQGYSPAQQDINILQQVTAGQVQAEPFSTWAGPVSVAAGVEHRLEKYTSVVDQASKLGLWFGGGFTPSTGRFTVLEAFGETIVPLLRDVTLVKSLDVNAAVRRTDYSTSGVVATWKVGGTWDVNDEIRLRGTESRDIRAPNMLELFNGGVATVAQTRDRTQTGDPLVNTRQITGGNPNLKPEIAKTYTIGGVYRPDWGAGLSASIDYYKIAITNAITTVTGQQIVDQCFGVGVPQNPAACANIVRTNPNNLADATIYTGGLNAQQQTVEGLDYEVSYRWQVGDVIKALDGGQLDLRLLASRRLTSETTLAGALTNALGTTTDGPKWRGLFTAGFLMGPSRTTISVRYLGPGVLNNFPAGHPQSIDINHYNSATYVELAENYDFTVFGATMTIYGVVQNLFDKAPPPVPTAGATSIGADSLHDLLGRAYRLGLRYKF